MRSTLLLAISFFLSATPSFAQEPTLVPKNYPAVFVGVEGNTSSGLKGVEYERIIHTDKQAAFGVSGTYIFKYNLMNLSLFSGSSEYRSLGLIMGTGTIYTSRNKSHSGFYLHTGFGFGLTHRQTYYAVINKWHPVGNIGLGWYLPFDALTGMQLSSSLLFASNSSIIRLKASFGF